MHRPAEFSAADKIQILFKEYDTLRAEIVVRSTNGYVAFTALAAVLLWLFGQPHITPKYLIALALMGGLTAVLVFNGVRDLRRCSGRVQVSFPG